MEKRIANEPEDGDTDVRVLGRCDCLPLCTDLSYDVSTSQANMAWSKYFQSYGVSKAITSQLVQNKTASCYI